MSRIAHGLLWLAVWFAGWTTTTTTTVGALNFKLHGVTYTLRKASDTAPLQDRCKSLDDVVADLTVLQGLADHVRVSSITDCNTGDIVLRALAQVGGNLRVWLGLDVGSTGQDFEFERSILLALLSTRNVTSVVGLTVLVSDNDSSSLTVNQTIQFRNDLKDDLISQGLGDRPVTIGYPLDTMLANPELATVDESVVYFHDTSYRDSTTTINEAATQLSNRVDQLLGTINDTIVNNRRVVVGATGWPDSGTTATSANRPSLRKWLRDVVCLAQDRGWDYYWDTAYDATRVFDDGRGHLGLLQEQTAEPPTVSTLKSYLVDYAVDCSQPAVPLEDPTSDVFPPPPTAAPTQSPTLAPTVPLPSSTPSTLPSVVPTTSVPPTIRTTTMVPSAGPTLTPTLSVATSAAPTRESERVASNQQGNDDSNNNNTDENATTDNNNDGGGKKRENLLELSILGAVAGALVGALVLIVQNRRRRAQDDKTWAYQSKRHADDDDEEEPHVLDVTSDELSYLYQGQEDDATTVDQPVEVKELDTSSQASPLLKVAEVPVEEPPPEEESIQDGKQCLVYVRERENGVKVIVSMDLTFCVCVPVLLLHTEGKRIVFRTTSGDRVRSVNSLHNNNNTAGKNNDKTMASPHPWARFGPEYVDKANWITVQAPPGKLGVVVDIPDFGPAVVFKIRDTSVLRGQVHLGDRLLAVNDLDVTTYSAMRISALIADLSTQPVRTFTLMRHASGMPHRYTAAAGDRTDKKDRLT